MARWGEPTVLETPGTRVAMIVEAEAEGPVRVQVGDGGSWIVATEYWRSGRQSVLVADLRAPTTTVAFRSVDAGRIVALDWDLFTPTGGEPRRGAGAPPPTPGVLPTELVNIGVISRADWGADPTTCTSTEDDWYRMAIHHTAGSQTSGGTVQGAVQALQAYAMGTGEYCDIPYQFLVGYDGSLWEGRPYDYYSGATGGGNNDGNAAVSFLGCYHPSGCATSHEVTEAMMTSGQLLVQTFATMHGIPSDDDAIRGHRDWPDNATACPGDWLYARLDELREPLGPDFAAASPSLACTPGEGARLELGVGEAGRCTLTVQNAGRAAWSPATTRLAPIPRDADSPMAGPSWLSGDRIVGVTAATEPGATGSFDFEVIAAAEGEAVLALGLVEDGVTWFADDGGPADGAIAVVVVGAPPTPDDGDGDTSASAGGERQGLPGAPVSLAEAGACGCGGGTGPGPQAAVLALAGVAAGRRRRG
jgi:N-acetylmuramoyl-L-alanine amidase